MQIDRMFQIVYILIDKKFMTAKALAEKFQVSTRTIYRDVDTLSLAGIPIYTTKGKGGGIHIMEQFVMNKSLLSQGDQNQVLLGLETIQSIGYEDVSEALSKLKHFFQGNDNSWIEVDFSNWRRTDYESQKFQHMKTALIHCKAIRFNYYDSKGDKSKRLVFPLKLLFKHRAWYLLAFCTRKEDTRIFKITRIQHVEVMEKGFDRSEYNLKDAVIYNRETIQLEIEINAELRHRVYDEFEADDIRELENGDFFVTLQIPEDEWLYNYLLSFGNSIQIHQPQYLRDILRTRLIKTLENYE